MENFKLIGSGDVQLNVNGYLVEKVKGVVICVHGMVEHSRRYEGLSKFLNNKGYSVYTYDHRGHGASLLPGEKKGFLGKDGFNRLVYDLDAVISYVKEKHPHELIFLLGHSMGSFITERYVQLYDKVDGIILSGSNYGTKSLGLGILLSRLSCIFKGEKADGKLLDKLSFGAFNSQFKPNRTAFDWLNRNEEEVDKYITDEMCGYVCSNRFYLDFFSGLKELSKEKHFAEINHDLPVLIISGNKDPVGGSGEGVKALYLLMSKYLKNIKIKLYQNARHEILLENNKDEVYADIAGFLGTITG